MDTNRYIVTVEYVTPSGKRSTYTDTIRDDTPFKAIERAKECLCMEPNRKVARIVSASLTG